jgi:AcrR family transcriptional regulator
MAETGDVDVKVVDIVTAAGLSNAAFYRHFESKDELLLAVLDRELRQLVLNVRAAMARADTPLEAIERWVRAMLAQVADAPARERNRVFAVNRGRLSHRYPEVYAHCVDELTSSLAEQVRAAVSAGDLPKTARTHGPMLAFRLVMGRVEDHVLAGTAPAKRERDATVAFVLGGLAAGPVRRP